jgi:hypothetical protein
MCKFKHLKKEEIVVIYILTSNTSNLLNPALHATCFSHLPLPSGIKVHNLKSKLTCVKVYILQSVISHVSYNCHNIGLLLIFYSL